MEKGCRKVPDAQLSAGLGNKVNDGDFHSDKNERKV